MKSLSIVLGVLVCALCSMARGDVYQRVFTQEEEGIKVSTKVDPFTDQGIMVISKEATVKGGFLGLYIRCSNGIPDVYLASMSSQFDDKPEITSRIGAGEVLTEVWGTYSSKDGSAAFHPEPKSFILKIGEPERVAIRYQYKPQDLNEQLTSLFSDPEIITVVFDLKGVGAHMNKFKSVCGWN